VLEKHRGKPAIEALASELGMHFSYGKEIYDSSRKEDYGNALLSKHPFVQSPTRHNVDGIAGLVVADVAIPVEDKNCVIRVGVTHLDPGNEDLRVKQVNVVVKVLNWKKPKEYPIYWRPRKHDKDFKSQDKQYHKLKVKQKKKLDKVDTKVPHLLLGDLNAMRQSDYTQKQWDVLNEFFEQQTWTPPRSDAMRSIDAYKYKDVVLEVAEGELLTAWTYQTIFRIDYVLASSDFPHPCIAARRDDNNVSDHYPVWADFLVSAS